MNKKILKNLVKNESQWKELKSYFLDKADKLISLDSVSGTLSDKQIALQVKANRKAYEIIKKTLKHLEGIGTEFDKENESFK